METADAGGVHARVRRRIVIRDRVVHQHRSGAITGAKPINRAAGAGRVLRDQVVDDGRLGEVGDRDAAAPPATPVRSGRILLNDVAYQTGAASREQRHTGAGGIGAQVAGDAIVDHLGGRVAADVDADAPRAGAARNDIVPDGVAFDARRAEVTVDADARAPAIAGDVVAANRR